MSRRNTNIDSQVKTTGKVAFDAKLDWITFDASQQFYIVASGGIVQRGRTEREVRVDMRSGPRPLAGNSENHPGCDA